MTSTTMKMNRTGMELAGERGRDLLEATKATEPSTLGDGEGLHENRREYLREGHDIGSLPPGVDGAAASLLDKLGERLAFERAGVRLYEALLDKLADGGFEGGPSRADLEHIRRQEAEHFVMLEQTIREQGGDPTLLTPSADLVAVESMGIHQVVVDPRTTLPQALHAILVAELADNAGWELLMEVARAAGADALVSRFERAHEEEQEHLRMVRGWLVADAAGGGAREAGGFEAH